MICNRWYFALLYVSAFMIELSSSLSLKIFMNFPCYKPEYQQKRFDCKNTFFLSFRNNPYQSCKEAATKLGECTLKVDQECLGKANPTSFLYESYKSITMNQTVEQMEKVYCRDAGLLSPVVRQKGIERAGCSLDMYAAKSSCIRNFQTQWRLNRGNTKLCRKYEEMGRCIQEAIRDHCTRRARRITMKARLVMDKLVSPLNPFCVHEKSDL